MGNRCVKFSVITLHSLILVTGCSIWHFMGKSIWKKENVALHKYSLGYKKMVSNMVRSTKTGVSCLHSSMAVGVSWFGGAWVLSALREPWMPTGILAFRSRAWSPPFWNWTTRQCSNITATHTPKTTTAFLKKLRVKVLDWPNPYWKSVGHHKTEGDVIVEK